MPNKYFSVCVPISIYHLISLQERYERTKKYEMNNVHLRNCKTFMLIFILIGQTIDIAILQMMPQMIYIVLFRYIIKLMMYFELHE